MKEAIWRLLCLNICFSISGGFSCLSSLCKISNKPVGASYYIWLIRHFLCSKQCFRNLHHRVRETTYHLKHQVALGSSYISLPVHLPNYHHGTIFTVQLNPLPIISQCIFGAPFSESLSMYSYPRRYTYIDT